MTHPTFDTALIDRLSTRSVGRRREVEILVAALAGGRHLLIEGPPGTGKSTVLRGVAEESEIPFEFVEGNAELTPARLIGAFDPARVLTDGYTPDVFLDGPLARSLRHGGLLYVEEINRVPEETLNVLITVMSEGRLHVPRLGEIGAADGFRLVAAMNPYDAVGTARISSAVYDRCCRVSMDYQDAEAEQQILGLRVPPDAAAVLGPAAVALVRDTRDHPDLRTGSSVRGSIDLVGLAADLAALRGVSIADPGVTRDAALAALSGRVTMRDGSGRTPEQVVTELWELHFGSLGEDGPGKARGPEAGPASPGPPEV